MSKPLLTLVIPSKDKDNLPLKRLLGCLEGQNFPKEKLEILIATKGNSEEARGHAILEAKGDILGFLCTDNLLRDTSFLRTMVWHAAQDGVAGAYTSHYDYVRYDKPLSRYFALLGTNDPVCWWLGKSDRLSYLKTSKTHIQHIGNHMPSIGDNGFFVKAALMKQVVINPEDHFVIDVVKDMWKHGYTNYYVVSEMKLWHLSGDSWKTYFKNRFRYAKELYFDQFHKRRWKMVETKRDWMMAVLFALSSLTILPQFLLVTRGWLKVKDPAWFLHIPISIGLTFIYGFLWLRYQLSFARWIGKTHLKGA